MVPDELPLAMLTLGADGSVVAANGAWTAMSALTREDSLGDGWLRAVEPVDRETLRRRLHSAARASATASMGSADWRLIGPRGRRWSRWWWGPASTRGLLACVADIDEDRAREFDLWRRSSHGPITRLVDQDQFLTMADWALGHRHRTGTAVAAIVVDIGGSSDETGPGRQRAAEWRGQAAGRMLAVIGITAAATQAGPDEFVFLRHDLREPAQASEIAGKLCDVARPPRATRDRPGTTAISVGIAVAHQHDTAETLITGAQVAARRHHDRLGPGAGTRSGSGGRRHRG